MVELVGIVLVSHSERLACGLRDVLEQVGTAEVPVEAAGGTHDGRIGTSYERVAAAIARADRGAGVLVLADLGSAVLTVRAVLADRGGSPGVVLVDAPFVEGAVAAAVLAATGADLATVTAAAVEARDATKL
jgi:phosphoenolpyruvate---glycerone phosphotransferase subunit DhaM